MFDDVLVSCSSLIKGVWLSKLTENIAIVEELADLYHYNGVILVIPPSSQQEFSAILRRQQSLFITVILYKKDNHFLLMLREKEAVFVFLEDSETKQFLLQSLRFDTKVFSVSSWFIFTELFCLILILLCLAIRCSDPPYQNMQWHIMICNAYS